jgi:excisionase family DNA binding protein
VKPEGSEAQSAGGEKKSPPFCSKKERAKRKTAGGGRFAAYSPNDAAVELDLSRSKIYDLMARGLLRYVTFGAFRRIPGSEIERLLTEGTK